MMVAGLALATGTASADVTWGFAPIMNYSNQINASGAQYSMTVSSGGSGIYPGNGQTRNKVNFTFSNIGSITSSITDVYFQDGTLLELAGSTFGGVGVAFQSPANPGDLPGGNNVGFQTTAEWSADSDSPVTQNGVNNSTTGIDADYVTITFWLQDGRDYNDTINALNLPFDQWTPQNHGLRVGLHLQGFPDDGSGIGSGAFITSVPLPTTSMLAMAGLGGVAVRRRRR
jgi:MYXO-CTERM domain-containing protein